MTIANGFRVRAMAFAIVLQCLHLSVPAQAAKHQQLNAHVPKAVKQLTPVRRLEAEKTLQLAIGLPLRDQQGLQALLHDLHDPASPNFRHYLTPKQFTERFGPTQEDYDAVKAWAKANGLEVAYSHPNRVVLNVKGTAATIERALNIRLNVFNHPTEDRTFFAPDSEPSFDLDVQIQNISGLEDFHLRKPHLHSKSGAAAVARRACKKGFVRTSRAAGLF